jgi:membrane-associated phospholipid phosphatase
MEVLTGYAVFHWIATWANPFCDAFFRALTDLGNETFYYLAIAVLFWLADRRRAGVLLLLLLLSGYVNTFAKLWAHTPRPDPGLIRVLDFRPYQSGNPAFPSGHAQAAVVFWAYLASWVERGGFSVIAALLVLLISFSRLYLGVHFPIDIVGGALIGAALMLILRRPLERWSQSDF